jgi:V8-like Glu-specific endopeptidase
MRSAGGWRAAGVWAGAVALVVAGLAAGGSAGAAVTGSSAGAAVTGSSAGAAVTGGSAGTAGSGATPDGTAVVHTVSGGAQAAARGFWTPARMKSATAAGASAAAGTSGTPGRPQATAAPPPGTPDPVYFSGVPTVGALFFTTGTQAHFCTASVVDSVTLDLVLTAAHCVYGSSGPAANVVYVPNWHQGVSPYGAWPVAAITVARGWQQSQDPDLDFAFLAVTPPAGTSTPIQLVTGGLRLGINTRYAQPVTPVGYNNTDDQPIKCATSSQEFEPTQIEFYCNNYQDGTSGGPWIAHFNPVTGTGTVVGDIGGYEQGGDYAWQSFSPYYSWPTLRLFLRAQLGQAHH